MTDGMADSKGASIPAWQRKDAQNEKPQPTQEQSDASVAPTSVDLRSSLLEHAQKFLQDNAVKGASIDKKKQFLEEKGLTKEETETLLQEDAPGIEQPSQSTETGSDLKTVHDSTDSLPTSSTSASAAPASSSASQNPPQASPPIITYPEFLLQAQKPPPLITAQRLLYALYGVSAITATAYGANKYLVEPMLQSLTSSRHDLFSTTLALLERLNQKLEANVSTIPSTSKITRKPYMDDDDDDISSIASDPTELFHRDIATQTSPSLAQTPSSPDSPSRSSSPYDLSAKERSERYTTSHTARLNTIRSNLTYLISTEETSPPPSSSQPQDSLYPNVNTPSSNAKPTTQSQLSDLQAYLHSLTYNTSSSSSSSAPYDYSGSSKFRTSSLVGGGGATNTAAAKGGEGSEDVIAEIKREIRGLKGVLISSRNFPSGTAR